MHKYEHLYDYKTHIYGMRAYYTFIIIFSSCLVTYFFCIHDSAYCKIYAMFLKLLLSIIIITRIPLGKDFTHAYIGKRDEFFTSYTAFPEKTMELKGFLLSHAYLHLLFIF